MKQIKDYTKNDFKDLVTKIVKDGQVVLHEQELTQQELTQVCEKMGYVETNDYFMNPKDAPAISIVSGQLDKDNRPIGMFRDQELQWHANGTGRHKFREICVGLYCVYECVDTVLSINNNCNAFAEMSQEKKNFYRNIDIRLDNSGPRARLTPKIVTGKHIHIHNKDLHISH